MILTYSDDRFVNLILSGSKIHTIRTDINERWRAGMPIQHWRGNPRNVRQKPYQFGFGECKSVQHIRIKCYDPNYSPEHFGILVYIDFRYLTESEIETLAINDGLSVAEFKAWFTPLKGQEYVGRIIHYTNLKY